MFACVRECVWGRDEGLSMYVYSGLWKFCTRQDDSFIYTNRSLALHGLEIVIAKEREWVDMLSIIGSVFYGNDIFFL